jgi:flotillin
VATTKKRSNYYNEKLPELVRTQVEAVKNIKIDKITVWDSGNNGDNGAGSTAVAGMMKTVPPLNDLFNMAGLNLPTYLKAMTNLKKLNQLLQNKINTLLKSKIISFII